MKLDLIRTMQNTRLDFPATGGFRRRNMFSVALLALTIVSAAAHPGHGLGDADAAHLVTSPYHLSVMAGCAAGIGLFMAMGARLAKTPRARRLLQVGAVCGAVAAAVLWMS
jgi:hypothetical protein